jgi:hypothetical protein
MRISERLQEIIFLLLALTSQFPSILSFKVCKPTSLLPNSFLLFSTMDNNNKRPNPSETSHIDGAASKRPTLTTSTSIQLIQHGVNNLISKLKTKWFSKICHFTIFHTAPFCPPEVHHTRTRLMSTGTAHPYIQISMYHQMSQFKISSNSLFSAGGRRDCYSMDVTRSEASRQPCRCLRPKVCSSHNLSYPYLLWYIFFLFFYYIS